eukprot:m.93758 g.93758  ORF g.93758 m.93758 type:complete len:236 (+) comp10016_c0_seq1:3271-3978(+)
MPSKVVTSPPAFTTYKTFILSNERFSIGDKITIKAPSGSGHDFIATIQRIHTDKRGEVHIDGRWYYRPEETAMGRQPWHGINEVLDSDHVDTFHVRCVNGKCTICTLEEYEQLGAKGTSKPQLPVFFCRSKYLKNQQRIEEELPRYCACKQPQNPEYELVGCDKCNEWYFANCVGLRKGEAADLDEWVCPNCIVRMPGYQRNKRPTDDLAALVREGKCWPWPGPRRSEAAKRFKP